ncbi:D-arabinose 1-dehydrogenase, Zn-dependent alcohol dehydrogenase family [Allokutzneria albata]|uniref:D-arabinose 1-dehydrogenase, Zn-dependent alcohol dehydrogenase family n=1 Tax=Allokutzneria albata TaxID=211114 RepID=A0A1G9T945_ALLAB|nr:D-arabinose 1-dehydrogenase, Zn-dependent alcohol dehydrogenase family [Allokutzneria albata]
MVGVTATMLAGRLDLTTKRFAVEEVPVPDPAPNEVLVAVRASGVCLSDLHLIGGVFTPAHNSAPAVTLGHEVAGVIEAVGADVPDRLRVGQRVALQAGQSCGRCDNCVRGLNPCLNVLTRGVDYDGGWAEYTVARHDTVVPIPGNLPFEQAAIIPDAVSTPYAAIVTTAQVRVGESAGVWGTGGLGTHAVQILRLVGSAPIIAIDPNQAARERALGFGADTALDPLAEDFAEQLRAATGGKGLDHAFDFAGAGAARKQAVKSLSRKGKLVLAGLTPERLEVSDSIGFCYELQQVLGHYGSLPQHVEDLIGLAGHGRLDFSRSITDRIPLAEADRAVKQLHDKVGDPIRLVLTP